MLILFKLACLALLFALLVFAGQRWILALAGYLSARRRLRSVWYRRFFAPAGGRGNPRTKLFEHLSELLLSSRTDMAPGTFLFAVIVLGLAGVLGGTLFFEGVKGALASGLLLASLPYIWLRMRLITQQMQTGYRLLPAIEVFYQIYVLAESKNIRQVLGNAVEGGRMMHPVHEVFGRLYRNLMIHADTDKSLKLFALSLGNQWAEHFVSLLRTGLTEGADIAPGLKELIADMRASARADRIERNRLLEIRIANFTPILFLAVFLIVNFRIDAEQAWFYYVQSAEGRDMLLDALILIGASFVMGIYLSLRRM